MGTIRDRIGKIHMYTHGVSFGIPEYLAEKGLDLNIEYVGDGMKNSVLAIEIFKTKKVEKEEEHDSNECIQEDQRETRWGSSLLCSLRRSDGSGGR